MNNSGEPSLAAPSSFSDPLKEWLRCIYFLIQCESGDIIHNPHAVIEYHGNINQLKTCSPQCSQETDKTLSLNHLFVVKNIFRV